MGEVQRHKGRGPGGWRSTTTLFLRLSGAFILLGCEPQPSAGTGGVTTDETFAEDGRSCGRGILVGMTDYASTNIALISLDGQTLSGSFLSSASTETKLTAPLSGDVGIPTERMSGEIVLIDRYPASVLTFVEPKTAAVRGQISVRTGFDANPQDYLELAPGRGLVTRFEENPDSGVEPYDQGDDALVLDTQSLEISGRIDLRPSAMGPQGRARPTRLVRAGDFVYALLTALDSDFLDAAPGRVLALDGESGVVLREYTLENLKNCGGIAVAPGGKQLAISCSDLLGNATDDAPEYSGVVLLGVVPQADSVAPDLVELARVTARDLGFGPFTTALGFASPTTLLAGTFGALEGASKGRPDRILALDMVAGSAAEILRSETEAFTLGDVRCVEPCDVCFVADGGRGVVHRYVVSNGALALTNSLTVESEIGLPPRLLGWF